MRSDERAARARTHHRRIRTAALLAGLLPALLAAGPAPRGDAASRISDGGSASEYWDFVARFDSGHHLFARFLITNEGPGERTGVAYGHFIEPGGKIRTWHNGRQQKNWTLGPQGLLLDIGKSDLDLRTRPWRLRIHKKKADIDLRFEPSAAANWNSDSRIDEPAIDLLASSVPVGGTVQFRDMPERLDLVGLATLTHTWMERNEGDVALRRLELASLGDEPALYLRDFEGPDGTRERWLTVVHGGMTVFETHDFELSYTGRSPAQQSDEYPIPKVGRIHGPNVHGEFRIKTGLVHHDPMQDIPQPFRFLLSFRMRPHRVWAESPFEVTVGSGPEELKIRGTGLTNVTYLNPPPPPS